MIALCEVQPNVPAPAGEAAPELPPVWFRGQAFRARKRFWHGTQRVMSPPETLERIRGYSERIGLTRLANVTGLDRIGVPTIVSVRPNSLYLSVDAGKGFTVEAATASAAMECIERFHAENAVLAEIRAPYEQVACQHSIVPVDRLAIAKDCFFSVRRPLRWTLGWDLTGQGEVAVPAAMVAMEGAAKRQSDANPFQTGSNGLSSGNTFLEAVAGGLLEVVERDAVTCQRLSWDQQRRAIPRVRLETVHHTLVQELLDRFDRAGVSTVLFDCTTDTSVPVYMAYVYDRQSRHIGVYRGYGAHLDPGIAMVRALTEAVQARLIFIAGSRDDFFRHSYLRLKHDDDDAAIRRLEAIPASVDARDRVSVATPTFEGDIGILIERLRAIGLSQVIVFDLTLPGFEVSAVRVVVPGLEGYMFDYYSPGLRARAFLEECRRCES